LLLLLRNPDGNRNLTATLTGNASLSRKRDWRKGLRPAYVNGNTIKPEILEKSGICCYQQLQTDNRPIQFHQTGQL